MYSSSQIADLNDISSIYRQMRDIAVSGKPSKVPGQVSVYNTGNEDKDIIIQLPKEQLANNRTLKVESDELGRTFVGIERINSAVPRDVYIENQSNSAQDVSFYVNEARAKYLSVDNISGVVRQENGKFSGNSTTSHIPEGDNLYYTDSRSRNSIYGIPGQIQYIQLSGHIGLSAYGQEGSYKETYRDTYGRVLSGSNPSTLSGYGIEDAYSKGQSDTRYVQFSALPDAYSLQPATSTILGGIKIGTGLSADIDGTLHAGDLLNYYSKSQSDEKYAPYSSIYSGYTLSKATSGSLGGIVLGQGMSADTAGVIDIYKFSSYYTKTESDLRFAAFSAVFSGEITPYILQPATSTILGGIKIGTGLSADIDGTLHAGDLLNYYSKSQTDTRYVQFSALPAMYTLPAATGASLGGVKIGAGIGLSADGTISVSALSRRQTFTVGNGADTSFNLVHGFDTTGISVSIRKKAGVRSQVIHDNFLTPGNENNAITVSFPSPPSANEYEITLIADNSVINSIYSLSGLSDANIANPSDGNFVMYSGGSWINASVPKASSGTLGLVRVGSNLNIDGDGVLSAQSSYTLPIAAAGSLGGIRVGSGLNIDGDGILSVPTPSGMMTTDTAQTVTGAKTFSAAGSLKAFDLIVSTGDIYVDYTDAGSNVHAYGFNFRFNGVYRSIFRWNEELDRFELMTRGNDGSPRDYRMLVPRTSALPTEFNAAGGVQISQGGLLLASSTPSSTTNKLYNIGSVLYWNGSQVGSSYTLPIAAAGSLGGIRVGSGLNIDGSGVLSAPTPSNMMTTDSVQTITGAKTFDNVLTVSNRAIFASTMSVHGSVNTILVTANHDQSTGAAWALTAATRFKSGAGANSDAKGHTSFTTFQDSVSVATAAANKARGFYAVAAQNDASDSICGTYYGYSTLTGSGGGTTTFTEYASFAVDDENYTKMAFINRYGLLIKTGSVAPSAGWFGVYIQDGPASPSRYSIYTGNAPSRFGGSIELPSFTPSSTANRLYNISGTLYWNGAPVGTGALTGSGIAGQLTRWSDTGAITGDAGMVTIQTGNVTRVLTLGDGAVANPVALRLNSNSTWSNYVIHQINGADVWAFGVTTAGSRHFRIANNAGASVIDFPLIIEDASAGPITLGGSTLRPISTTGVLNVAALLTASQSLSLPSYTPGVTSSKLYNVGGTLHWDGAPVGGTSSFVPSPVRNVAFNASANADAAYISAYSRVTPDATTRVLTIPQTLGVANDEITVEQVGANMLTITAGASVSFRPPGIASFRPRVDGSTVTLKCVFKNGSTSTWTVIGDYV